MDFDLCSKHKGTNGFEAFRHADMNQNPSKSKSYQVVRAIYIDSFARFCKVPTGSPCFAQDASRAWKVLPGVAGHSGLRHGNGCKIGNPAFGSFRFGCRIGNPAFGVGHSGCRIDNLACRHGRPQRSKTRWRLQHWQSRI